MEKDWALVGDLWALTVGSLRGLKLDVENKLQHNWIFSESFPDGEIYYGKEPPFDEETGEYVEYEDQQEPILWDDYAISSKDGSITLILVSPFYNDAITPKYGPKGLKNMAALNNHGLKRLCVDLKKLFIKQRRGPFLTKVTSSFRLAASLVPKDFIETGFSEKVLALTVVFQFKV